MNKAPASLSSVRRLGFANRTVNSNQNTRDCKPWIEKDFKINEASNILTDDTKKVKKEGDVKIYFLNSV